MLDLKAGMVVKARNVRVYTSLKTVSNAHIKVERIESEEDGGIRVYGLRVTSKGEEHGRIATRSYDKHRLIASALVDDILEIVRGVEG